MSHGAAGSATRSTSSGATRALVHQEGTEITTGGHKLDLVAADFNPRWQARHRVGQRHRRDRLDPVAQRGNTVPLAPTQPAVGANPRRLVAADLTATARSISRRPPMVTIGARADRPGQRAFALEPPVKVGDGPLGLATGDFNRDGLPDLAAANNGSKTVSVLLRRAGAGSCPTQLVAPTGQTGANAVAAADFNGDGRADLAVSNQTSKTVTVLINTTPAPAGLPPRTSTRTATASRSRSTATMPTPRSAPASRTSPATRSTRLLRQGRSHPRLQRRIAWPLPPRGLDVIHDAQGDPRSRRATDPPLVQGQEQGARSARRRSRSRTQALDVARRAPERRELRKGRGARGARDATGDDRRDDALDDPGAKAIVLSKSALPATAQESPCAASPSGCASESCDGYGHPHRGPRPVCGCTPPFPVTGAPAP